MSRRPPTRGTQSAPRPPLIMNYIVSRDTTVRLINGLFYAPLFCYNYDDFSIFLANFLFSTLTMDMWIKVKLLINACLAEYLAAGGDTFLLVDSVLSATPWDNVVVCLENVFHFRQANFPGWRSPRFQNDFCEKNPNAGRVMVSYYIFPRDTIDGLNLPHYSSTAYALDQFLVEFLCEVGWLSPHQQVQLLLKASTSSVTQHCPLRWSNVDPTMFYRLDDQIRMRREAVLAIRDFYIETNQSLPNFHQPCTYMSSSFFEFTQHNGVIFPVFNHNRNMLEKFFEDFDRAVDHLCFRTRGRFLLIALGLTNFVMTNALWCRSGSMCRIYEQLKWCVRKNFQTHGFVDERTLMSCFVMNC